jgi:hypothetical protein
MAPIAAQFLKGTVRCSPCAVCTFAQTRVPFWRGIAPSKGDQYDHDRAGVPRQRASMPVLGRVGERSGKHRSFLRPRRDLGERRRSDREIDRRAGDQDNRRAFAPSGGLGLTVPDGPADQPRQPGDVDGDAPGFVAGGSLFRHVPAFRRLVLARGLKRVARRVSVAPE